jgi:hypothetical protein
MKQYRMIFYRGRDRDDWREMEFPAYDMTDALDRAVCMTPDGWTLKRVRPVRPLL